MPKKIRVLAIGTEVVVIKDTVSHGIPQGKVAKIAYWDGSDTVPVYRLKGYGTMVWFTDIKPTTTTQKPKEPKTMTKKPGTSHGKPTAKGLRVEKKPTAAKVSKYPAPRVQIAAIVPVKSLDKMTKLELIETYYVLRDQFDNQAADHCIAGTKLDRALVDLKEAKKRIKELSKELEATK